MRTGLSQGKSFSEMMESLGCSSTIVTQLSLAEVHGNLHLSLGKIEEYLDNLAKVKKKLIEVATYPLICWVSSLNYAGATELSAPTTG